MKIHKMWNMAKTIAMIFCLSVCVVSCGAYEDEESANKVDEEVCFLIALK